MGGGAVRVVPFTRHGPACSPAHNSGVSVPTGGPYLTQVTIDHYGPIKLLSSGTAAVTIEREDLHGPPGYSSAGISFTNAVSGSNPRALVITCASGHQFAPGYRYRIKPILSTANLCCDQLTTGSNVKVADYEYIFEVMEFIGP